MAKKKSFAVWMLKDVANTLSEIKGEVLPSVQETSILTQNPTTNVHQSGSPNPQPEATKPTQSPNRLITGTRVQNWRDRLINRQILSRPVEKSSHQEVDTKPKRKMMWPKPEPQTQNPTTGTHRFCYKCGKKYLLDTTYRRCVVVGCGGKISLTEGEERALSSSTRRAEKFGGSVVIDTDTGCSVCHKWPCECSKEKTRDMSIDMS